MRIVGRNPLPRTYMRQNPLPDQFRGKRQYDQSEVLQQDQPLPADSYLSYFQPDVAARQEVRYIKAQPLPPPVPPAPVQTTALPILMTDLSGLIAVASTPQLAISANNNRQRFIIINPFAAPSPLFFSFKNSPNSQIVLQPGEYFNEFGPCISVDEIWVQSASAGAAYGAYEGVPKPGA